MTMQISKNPCTIKAWAFPLMWLAKHMTKTSHSVKCSCKFIVCRCLTSEPRRDHCVLTFTSKLRYVGSDTREYSKATKDGSSNVRERVKGSRHGSTNGKDSNNGGNASSKVAYGI